MDRSMRLPAIGCPDCKAEIDLAIGTAGASIQKLSASCSSCDWKLDLLEEARGQYAVNRDRAKKVSREVARTIAEARKHLPKDRDEWGEVLRNPRHPFTLAVLTGLVLVAMELSGFGIFLAVTWILGNLILNPVGWVLIPLIVAVAVMYRDRLRREKLKALKSKLDALDQQRDSGEITDEQCRRAKQELLEASILNR